MSRVAAIATVSLTIAAAIFLVERGDSVPATGALTQLAKIERSRFIPLPEQKPMLEVGEKTKLFMDDDAYLFGTQILPSTAALSYRVGLGKELVRESGNRWTGEVSFYENESDSASSAKVQTRLSGAYLRQLNDRTDFSAGLSTDLASKTGRSTLELHLSMELSDSLSLQLSHDQGASLKSRYNKHQSALTIEKKF